MNKSTDISQLLIDLIMNLNEIPNKVNKILRPIHIWSKINNTKYRIRSIVKKDIYDAYDIYNFLQFIGVAYSLNLGRKLPNNISYSYHKVTTINEISSGIFTVIIQYTNSQQLQVTYKPVISLEDSKINMEWIIGNNITSIVDFKTVTSDMQRYSTTVNKLSNTPINITEPVSVTKILTFSSADILYQAFLMCIEVIFRDIEKRYKKNEKKK